MQYDNITVVVEKGDITNDNADIIVNSTDSSFSLSGELLSLLQDIVHVVSPTEQAFQYTMLHHD